VVAAGRIPQPWLILAGTIGTCYRTGGYRFIPEPLV
jgi:hypothetical protein